MDKITIIQRKGSLTVIPKKITLVRTLLVFGFILIFIGHFIYDSFYIFLGLIFMSVGTALWTIKR